MYKNDKNQNKEYGKSVNHQLKLKYQKKFPKNSKVFIKNKSQDKPKNDNSTNDFKSIMKQMYSEIVQNKKCKEEDNYNTDININKYISPTKRIYYNTINTIRKKERKNARKKLFPSHSHNYIFEKVKDKLSLKRVKINKENEEIFSPFFDYNNKLMDRFTQISIIKPNKNDIFLEQNSDSDIPNDEYVYFYEPNKELRLELGNSSKREIKNIFEYIFTENKLIFWNEINFTIDGQISEDKIKFNTKYKDLIKKEENYDKLINKYNILLKELNELKNKNTISSESVRGEEKKIQHLEDIIIVNNINNTKGSINKRKKPKIKKVKKKRINSLTPNKKYYSSSEETKTRDNSKNAFGSSLSNELIKNKKNISNIMIISKENEFNLAASYTKIITNDNNILNKPKKKIKKIIKKTINKENKEYKENKENNWNSSNKIIENMTFNYMGNTINNDKKNKMKKGVKKIKKRILKPKENSREKNRASSINNSCRKIKRINLPVIHIKNETMSYNIKKKYFRFKTETKSVDYKYDKNNMYHTNTNIKQLEDNITDNQCYHSDISINKKRDKNDDIIVKNINLNIINKLNNIENEDKDKNKIIDNNINKNIENNNLNNSENKELSYLSNEIKKNNDYFSEDEKIIKEKINIENYNEKNETNDIKNENKEKKYTFKIKIVKYATKKKKYHIYFDTLFKKFINKILIKRIFKKWLKLSKY